MRVLRTQILIGVVAAGLLVGCSSTPEAPDRSEEPGGTPWAAASLAPQLDSTALNAPGPWAHYRLPGKAASRFTYVRKDGRNTMLATAKSSASMLRYPVQMAPSDIGSIRFSWNVPELIAGADMALRDVDDSPVRIVLAFDGDRSTLSSRNQALSELARALTGEELPYATLMYVWCNTCVTESVIVNPRTDRIRKLVVESGAARLKEWLSYERDIRADYEKAFGEPPGTLLAVGIMTDSDNTRSATRAWYGPVELRAAALADKTR